VWPPKRYTPQQWVCVRTASGDKEVTHQAITTRTEALRANRAPGEGDCPARQSGPVPPGVV